MSGEGKVITTGRQYAIGWYDDWYVIWNVSKTGKPVAYEESRSPEGWKILAERFLQLESIDLTRYNPSDGMDTTNVGQPVTDGRKPVWVTPPATARGWPEYTKYHNPNSKYQESNSSATAGGVLGIIAVLTGLIPFIGIGFGFLFGILAIIFSGMGLSKADRVGTGKGIAITGLVLGILTIFFKIIPGVNLL